MGRRENEKNAVDTNACGYGVFGTRNGNRTHNEPLGGVYYIHLTMQAYAQLRAERLIRCFENNQVAFTYLTNVRCIVNDWRASIFSYNKMLDEINIKGIK